MVDHLTRITFSAALPHARELAAAVAALGFTVRVAGWRVVAESAQVEAQDAKRALRARGFADGDYEVFLEYVRQWGVL